ncbi:hypothetical protein ACQ9ZG_32555 [Streptomyces araujoniae]|uniref:hypothetical protein n=1 Tax=Streptomyces sp. ZEA17I TaxID=2202516 RepID=UPI001C64194F|nr:hypothetical protein [Streptomyces sp. ZEA17I]
MPNVVHLDPASAVFEAMKEWWARQQTSRSLQAKTIAPRLRLVDRLWEFSGLYPWQWTSAEGEAFIAHLRSQRHPIRMSTTRTVGPLCDTCYRRRRRNPVACGICGEVRIAVGHTSGGSAACGP